MVFKILGAIVLALALFAAFVSTRDGHFMYERSGVIHAPAEKIFPYISEFKKGSQWSPYEKGIEMPKQFSDRDGEVGSWMEFGPSKSGSGRLEILELIPNQMVKIKLAMTAPLAADNLVTYKLTPQEGGTLFSWSMEGDGGFVGKLMNTLIDCEKMVAGQFTEGINNLKERIESQGANSGIGEDKMNFTETPQLVTTKNQHFVYVEKEGEFKDIAQKAWEEAHRYFKQMPAETQKTGAFSLFKMKPKSIYRAGFAISAKPAKLPEGLKYEEVRGAKYNKFILKGSYGNMGPAWGRTMEITEKSGTKVRDDFYMENYANDPSTTPESDLISELMVPVKD